MKNVSQWVFFTLFIVFSTALFFKQSFVFCVPLVVAAYLYFHTCKQLHYSALEKEFQDLKEKFLCFEDNTKKIAELSDKINQVQLANGMRKIR